MKHGYLNEYNGFIVSRLDAGTSIAKIQEEMFFKFDLDVNYNTLHSHIRRIGEHSQEYRGNNDRVPPICKNCTECLKCYTEKSRLMFVCIPSKKIITGQCTTSPMWCEKRKEKV